jgi:hypothetical protein
VITVGGWVRCGSCSVCSVALEVPEDRPDGEPRPRSPKVRAQGHRHSRPWSVVSDGDDLSGRAWVHVAPGARRWLA